MGRTEDPERPPIQFRIGDMEKRLKAADPWAESTKWRQSITAKMLQAVDAEID